MYLKPVLLAVALTAGAVNTSRPDALPGAETVITLVVAFLMATLVSTARVLRERGIQRREGKPLSSLADMAADTLYGALAGVALTLLEGAVYPLPFKATVGLAMFAGALGPPAWDLVAGVVSGKYHVNIKKDGDS